MSVLAALARFLLSSGMILVTSKSTGRKLLYPTDTPTQKPATGYWPVAGLLPPRVRWASVAQPTVLFLLRRGTDVDLAQNSLIDDLIQCRIVNRKPVNLGAIVT